MKIRPFAGLAALCAFVVAATFYVRTPAHGFDLQGSPLLVKRPAADITDTYFFPSPTNPNNVVAVMDVYPSIPPGAGATTYFDQGVLYTMKFDNLYASRALTPGARPVEDLVIQFAFSAPSGGTQQFFVYGPGAPTDTGATTHLIDGGVASGSGFINKSTQYGSGGNAVAVFVGARRDPSFFNAGQFFNIFPDRNQGSTKPTCLPGGANTCPAGFNSNTPSAPVDFFASSNVLSIVAELPKAALSGTGNGIVAYWATTSTSNGQ